MKLFELAGILKIEFHGNPNEEILFLSSPENPKKNSVCYVSQKKFINKKLAYAAAVITSRDFLSEIPNKNLLISDNPKIDFAEITKIFNRVSSLPIFNKVDNFFRGIDVSIGNNFSTGVGVVIEDSVSIGNNVHFGHNVIIKKSVIIGNNVEIGPGTVIGSKGFGNIQINDKEWKHVFHHGSVFIHDNVRIGANCTIDRGTIDNTIINQGVIIDNQVHIAHNVEIGMATAIAANVGIAGSCKIGKRNMIGGMVGIVDHIETGDDVIISATSAVTKHLMDPGVYTGIMPITKHSLWKRIALWITKLDKIAKFIDTKNKTWRK